jgi:hypothetical protein
MWVVLQGHCLDVEEVSRGSLEPRLKSANYFRAFFLTTFFTAFLTAFLMAFAFFLAAIPLHLLLLILSSPLTSFMQDPHQRGEPGLHRTPARTN